MSDPFANLPKNHFGAIYADPPWQFETWDKVRWHSSSGETRLAPYVTMNRGEPELMAMTTFPRRREDEVSVYVIQAGDFVKIGIAKDPQDRINAMQTGNPHKMRAVFSLVVEERLTALEIERAAHGILAPFRQNGEWFACTPEMASGAITQAHDDWWGS